MCCQCRRGIQIRPLRSRFRASTALPGGAERIRRRFPQQHLCCTKRQHVRQCASLPPAPKLPYRQMKRLGKRKQSLSWQQQDRTFLRHRNPRRMNFPPNRCLPARSPPHRQKCQRPERPAAKPERGSRGRADRSRQSAPSPDGKIRGGPGSERSRALRHRSESLLRAVWEPPFRTRCAA